MPRVRLPRPLEARQHLVHPELAPPPSTPSHHQLQEREWQIVVIVPPNTLTSRIKALHHALDSKHPHLGRQVRVDAHGNGAPVRLGLKQRGVALELHRDHRRQTVHPLVRSTRPGPIYLAQHPPVRLQDPARPVDGLLQDVLHRVLSPVLELDMLLRRLLLQPAIRRPVISHEERHLAFAQPRGSRRRMGRSTRGCAWQAHGHLDHGRRPPRRVGPLPPGSSAETLPHICHHPPCAVHPRCVVLRVNCSKFLHGMRCSSRQPFSDASRRENAMYG